MELVRVKTQDGLWLNGALGTPDPIAVNPHVALGVDACILVHGTGSNFYAPGVLETFADQALAAGLVVLRVNTRGHDGISSIPGSPKSIQGGATYEHVADCRLDLAVWIGFLELRGCSRIALCGHSMGGVKSAYAMAHDAHAAVKRLVLISSPRFHHQTYLDHPSGAPFRADLQTALAAVRDGRPEQLIAVTQPLSFLATAAGFLDKYGPADNYDWYKLLPAVPCPVLYVLGEKSPRQSLGFVNAIEALTQLASQCQHVTLSLVSQANTIYSGLEQVPFERVREWLIQVRGRELQ